MNAPLHGSNQLAHPIGSQRCRAGYSNSLEKIQNVHCTAAIKENITDKAPAVDVTNRDISAGRAPAVDVTNRDISAGRAPAVVDVTNRYKASDRTSVWQICKPSHYLD